MRKGKRPKLYLAGPEIFLPNAIEYANQQRALCEKYGFIGLHPMDNNIDLGQRSMKTALKVYQCDVRQVRECDIVVANCNLFRGALMDDGTAYELGYGNALGKPSYGYINKKIGYVNRVTQNYPWCEIERGVRADKDGYLLLDDFGAEINLMMQCGMTTNGGRLVIGDFESCLRAIRYDIDGKTLKLGMIWWKKLRIKSRGETKKSEETPPLFIPSK